MVFRIWFSGGVMWVQSAVIVVSHTWWWWWLCYIFIYFSVRVWFRVSNKISHPKLSIPDILQHVSFAYRSLPLLSLSLLFPLSSSRIDRCFHISILFFGFLFGLWVSRCWDAWNKDRMGKGNDSAFRINASSRELAITKDLYSRG